MFLHEAQLKFIIAKFKVTASRTGKENQDASTLKAVLDLHDGGDRGETPPRFHSNRRSPFFPMNPGKPDFHVLKY